MTDSLDRDPIVLLYDLARIMRTKFDQRARTREMTRAQWHILARVDRQPGLSQSELAAICEVEPITVARLVDRLEKRGLLERRPDPNDRRIWRLHNLPSARPILDEINAYREQLISDIDGYIGVDTREAMVNALLAIREQLSATTAHATQSAAKATRKGSPRKRAAADTVGSTRTLTTRAARSKTAKR